MINFVPGLTSEDSNKAPLQQIDQLKSAKELCDEVLRKIVPSDEERREVQELAEKFRKRVEDAATHFKLDAEAEIEGSVAKDTWLSGEADIDIFLKISRDISLKDFREISLKVAKKALEGYEWIERYAEHPYLEAYIGKLRVNIVPCYRTSAEEAREGKWLSATDRTPFHTNYVKSKLTDEMKNEVRLLKQFTKGIGVYGAEIKVKGFSGYLCELLILRFGSFLNLLKNSFRLKKEIIDLEGYYKGASEEARTLFRDSPAIVIDPIDKRRNVAAVVSREKLNEFIAASRYFLSHPSEKFFFPPAIEPFSPQEVKNKLKERGTDLFFIKFGKVKAVPDVLWGQLYSSLNAIKNLLLQYDFEILRESIWSDEKESNILLFELKNLVLPTAKIHMGPPIKSAHVERFLRKYLASSTVLSGPWIKEGRWYVEIKRKYRDAVELLKDKLRDGGKKIGVSNLIAKSIAKSLELVANEEILGFYEQNEEFAKFLTDFLIGKPSWLR